MTFITKLVGTFLFTLASLFVINKPPAPSDTELVARPVTVWKGLESSAPLPPATTFTTLKTAPNACEVVYRTAKQVGWPADQLSMVVAIAQRESRCLPYVTNWNDPNGGSYGVMQINGFWCQPSRYWPDGYLQAFGLVENCDTLYDMASNLRSALQIYRNSGWSPWGS